MGASLLPACSPRRSCWKPSVVVRALLVPVITVAHRSCARRAAPSPCAARSRGPRTAACLAHPSGGGRRPDRDPDGRRRAHRAEAARRRPAAGRRRCSAVRYRWVEPARATTPTATATAWRMPADDCPGMVNPDQEDTNSTGRGDGCDVDDDNDTVLDTHDRLPHGPEPGSGEAPRTAPAAATHATPDDDNDTMVDDEEQLPHGPELGTGGRRWRRDRRCVRRSHGAGGRRRRSLTTKERQPRCRRTPSKLPASTLFLRPAPCASARTSTAAGLGGSWGGRRGRFPRSVLLCGFILTDP